jgi:3-deoxy-D-manno-octulosonic-acid transferase
MACKNLYVVILYSRLKKKSLRRWNQINNFFTRIKKTMASIVADIQNEKTKEKVHIQQAF